MYGFCSQNIHLVDSMQAFEQLGPVKQKLQSHPELLALPAPLVRASGERNYLCPCLFVACYCCPFAGGVRIRTAAWFLHRCSAG